MTELRRVRNVELARIAWRDLAGLGGSRHDARGNLAARGLPDRQRRELRGGPARAALRPAARRARQDAAAARARNGQARRRGAQFLLRRRPRVPLSGRRARDGDDRRGEPTEPETYYVRVAQLLIKLLDLNTGDGFVYRVDTRLRPFGASGPLVVSVSSFESYLVQHGRDWERYAYVKARLIAGSEFAVDVFDLILTPFVYRRYLDYGVFEALRQMKTLIAQEVARKDMAENIKLGPGGIREIEFIVQAFQLVRGGRRPELQTRSLLRALPLLAGDRQLPDADRRGARALLPLSAHAREPATGAGGPADARLAERSRKSASGSRTRSASRAGPASRSGCGRTARSSKTEFEHVAWDADGRGARRGGDPASAAWAAGDVTATLAGTRAGRQRRSRGAAHRAQARRPLSAHGRGRAPAARGRGRPHGRARREARVAGEVAGARAADLSRDLPAQRVSRAAQRESRGARSAAEPRRPKRVARKADRRAADAARRAARHAPVRHAAHSRRARGAVRDERCAAPRRTTSRRRSMRSASSSALRSSGSRSRIGSGRCRS